MENSDGAYPRDSLSHLIGKRLEEVFPGRDDRVPQYDTSLSGEKIFQSLAPWISSSKREHDQRLSVRASGSITCETPIRRYNIPQPMLVHLRL